LTVRSVTISLAIIAFSFGMVMVNQINNAWAADHGGRPFTGGNMTSFMNYSDINVPTDRIGYNNTMRDITDYNAPADITADLGFFQALKYSSILFDVLFNSVFGFPQFLAAAFGMPQLFVPPLTIFIVLNHIFALIYMVTGRTFIY